MSSEQPTTATEKPEAAPNGESSRRSFLKGTAIALPAVMTLHSGAALAAASALRCRDNGAMKTLQTNYDPIKSGASGVLPSGSGEVMREHVTLYRRIQKKSNGTWTAKNNQNQYFDDVGTYFKDKYTGKWRFCRDGSLKVTQNSNTKNFTKGQLVSEIDTGMAACLDSNPPQGCELTEPVGYAVIHFDSNGNRVALGAKVGTAPYGSMCMSWTGACYYSIYRRHG